MGQEKLAYSIVGQSRLPIKRGMWRKMNQTKAIIKEQVTFPMTEVEVTRGKHRGPCSPMGKSGCEEGDAYNGCTRPFLDLSAV